VSAACAYNQLNSQRIETQINQGIVLRADFVHRTLQTKALGRIIQTHRPPTDESLVLPYHNNNNCRFINKFIGRVVGGFSPHGLQLKRELKGSICVIKCKI